MYGFFKRYRKLKRAIIYKNNHLLPKPLETLGTPATLETLGPVQPLNNQAIWLKQGNT